jgi:hypothetical protein
MTELWVKFQDTNPVKISTVGCRDVYDLLKSCRTELVNQLGKYDLNQLFLSNDDSTDTALWPSLLLPDIPGYDQIDSQKPLFIGLLPTTPHSRKSSFSLSSKKSPHPSRKRKWGQLNKVLHIHSETRPYTYTQETGYSYVPWKYLRDNLKFATYEQPIRAIHPQAFTLLMDNLTAISRCIDPHMLGNEGARLHLVASILYCVGQLFNDELRIEFDGKLSGGCVKAHGRFEFILRRNDRYVCVVQAKNYDFEQGMIQNIIGSEIASDVRGLDCVYGIVTNFDKWVFLKSSNNQIECDRKSSVRNFHDTEGLKEVAGKIYAMLSSDEEMAIYHTL